MKRRAKLMIARILGSYVRRLHKKAYIKIIAVVGTVGKTSTKFAIATVLAQKNKVAWQKGNYNDIVSVPLVFFDLPMPRLLNPIAWLVTFAKIEFTLHRPYPHQVVVVEVGTDFPGNL